MKFPMSADLIQKQKKFHSVIYEYFMERNHTRKYSWVQFELSILKAIVKRLHDTYKRSIELLVLQLTSFLKLESEKHIS